ncbi:MAG: hypothetical protein RIB60_02480 [Phycisphaerales bacterium]
MSLLPTRRCLERMSSAAALACLAGIAGAEPPMVLDHVPADAPLVISISNVGELFNDIDAANLMLGENGNPQAGLITMMGRGMPGMNLEGSAAAVVNFDFANPDNMGEDDVIVVLPISDFAAFTQGAEATDGVHQFAFGGNPAFARRAGDGYAVVGATAESVAAFRADAGNMPAHGQRLGHAGRTIADSADIAIIANVAPARQMMLDGLQDAQQQMLMFAAMGAQGQDVATPINSMMELVRAYIADAQTSTMGLSYDEGGFTLDWGVQFEEGSASAAQLQTSGDAASMLSRVPGGEYYLAYALDLRSPALADIAGKLEQMNAAMGDAPGAMPGQPQLGDVMKLASGTAGVLGASPAMMQTGLLANMVSYVRTEDAGAYADMLEASVIDANGQNMQGLSFQTTFGENAKTVGGVQVDTYGVKMSMDQAAAGGMGGMGSPQQMIGMMFGPSMGPNGHIAKLDGGVVQTMSPNETLLARSIDAAKNGNGLGADGRVLAASNRMPEGSMAQVLIAYNQLANTVGPMAMMFGAIDGFEPINAMDPVALGLGTQDGGVHARIFVPGPVVSSAMSFIPEQEDPFADDGWDDDTDEDPEF